MAKVAVGYGSAVHPMWLPRSLASEWCDSVPLDISSILNDWAFQPDEITARVIEGDGGKQRIQLRVDLGLMQMDLDGRPDGLRIEGAESWFAYHKQRQHEQETANPDGAPYLLDAEECVELMREAVQYYHRYLCFWHLDMYELCARDTERNLRLFAFVRNHAKHDRDKRHFDQWRPYVTMMHARAVATPLVELEQWDAAEQVIVAAIRGIEQFLDAYGQADQAPQLRELNFLRRWKKEVRLLSAPASEEAAETVVDGEADSDDPLAELQKQLDNAIAEERYEDASQLRDELRRLTEPPPPGGFAIGE